MMIRRLLRFGVGIGVSRGPTHCSHLSTSLHLPSTAANKQGNDDVWESVYRQEVPRTRQEMKAQQACEVVSPPNPRLLKVAIVGVPNSGKSTLINTLMGWRICSSSKKVHTTQVRARAIFNSGSTQLVFLDTPGIVTPQEVTKHTLQRCLLTEPEMSMQEVDLLAVVHDVSCKYTSNTLHTRLLRLLALHPTIPSVLLLNKVDLVKSKATLLEITQMLTEGLIGGKKFGPTVRQSSHIDKKALIRDTLIRNKKLKVTKKEIESHPNGEEHEKTTHKSETDKTGISHSHTEEEQRIGGGGGYGLFQSWCDISQVQESDVFSGKVRLTEQQVKPFVEHRTSWPLFEEVFMVSAKKGTGVDEVREFLLSCAQPHPWVFNSQVVTDQTPEEIVRLTVREKFLDYFKQEIPYTLKFSIDHWDLSESDLLSIIARVDCGRKGLVRVLLGSGGDTVSKIARQAEQELRNTFRTEVKLRLNIVYDRKLKRKMGQR